MVGGFFFFLEEGSAEGGWLWWTNDDGSGMGGDGSDRWCDVTLRCYQVEMDVEVSSL